MLNMDASLSAANTARYISIGQAVTLYSIRKSIVDRLIRQQRVKVITTVGGHRRILQSDLVQALVAEASSRANNT